MSDSDLQHGVVRAFAALLVAVAACGGGGGDARTPMADDPPMITTAEDLRAAEHDVVRLRGAVTRQKLGDGVIVDGVDVLCLDLRLPGGATTATLEGRLERWHPPVAEVDESGAISQGVTEPTTMWVLRDCTQV